MHGLALGVEDLGLEHDVDDDTGHGYSLAAVGMQRPSLWAGRVGASVQRLLAKLHVGLGG